MREYCRECRRTDTQIDVGALFGIEGERMTLYNTLADDFYINLNLNTEMQLPTARDTVLDFFGRVQKTYPSMRNFYTRENGDFVLEEDKDQGHQRWVSLEPRRVCSGYVNPPDMDSAFGQHDLVLQLVPFMLSNRFTQIGDPLLRRVSGGSQSV